MNGCCPGDSGEFGQDAPADSSSSPSFLDSLFSSSSTPADAPPADASYQVPSTPLVMAPAPVGPDPEEQYSKYFKLKDLCVTSLPYPNLPVDSATQNNMKKLGEALDTIMDEIGPYTLASVYRSPENQAALSAGAQGAASAAMASHATKSYHAQGLAADLTPNNGMTPTAFAQACYQNPKVAALLGQIVDKSEGGQHSLHISIQTSRFPKATPMRVAADGQYVRLTPEEITNWIAQRSGDTSILDINATPSDIQVDEDDEGDVTSPPWALILAGLAGAAGLGYFLYARRHRARS
jgi:hypothetical protein